MYLLSHRLGLDETDIRVARSDTDLASDGGGTYASRTAVLGGSAATLAADKVIAKARKIAAHAMEAPEDDIEFADGTFRVVGTDRAISLKEVAKAAYVPSRMPEGLETGLYEVASFSPEIPNFPNGCHVCEVEIDPETGPTLVLCRGRRYRHRHQPAHAQRPDPWRGGYRASAGPSPSISSMTRHRVSCSSAP